MAAQKIEKNDLSKQRHANINTNTFLPQPDHQSTSTGKMSSVDAKNDAAMKVIAFYEKEANLKSLCDFLRSTNGVNVKEAIQSDKRVSFFKGELMWVSVFLF